MKYKSQFTSGLAKARKRLKRLDTELLAAIHQASAGNTDGACEMALQAEDTSENLTLLLRSLPAYTGSPTAAANALDVMRVNIPVEIGFTEAGWFSLRMPLLLPKKGGGSANYIRSFLYPAMQEFFEKAEPVRFPDCVLIYRHVYDAGRPQRRYRDHRCALCDGRRRSALLPALLLQRGGIDRAHRGLCSSPNILRGLSFTGGSDAG